MTENLSAHYSKILALSENMLNSAQAGNWERLLEEGKAYNEQIIGLNGQSPAADSEQCAALIASILDNDGKIKLLIKARMDDLQGALSSVSQSIKLNQAYR